MSPPPETWFDRLSAPHTRRQSLKAAAAGAAAAVGLGLPLSGKLPRAEAATPTDCRKGCVWTVNHRFAARQAASAAVYGANEIAVSHVLGPAYGFIAACFWSGARMAKADETWRVQRQELPKCFQSFCPGFDPKESGGPCDGCNPPLYCNPCNAVDSGYICCIYEPGDPNNNCCPS